MDDTEKLISGKAIILEIVRAMRANLEPLLFSTVAPSRYFVYLHPADHQRLEGIVPLIVEQARRALDEEVRTWNAQGQPGKFSLKRLTGDKTAPPIEPLAEGWDIRFEPDADGEMQPGDIAVASELVLPVRPEFEGSKTRRLTTLRRRHHRRRPCRREPCMAPSRMKIEGAGRWCRSTSRNSSSDAAGSATGWM